MGHFAALLAVVYIGAQSPYTIPVGRRSRPKDLIPGNKASNKERLIPVQNNSEAGSTFFSAHLLGEIREG